MFENKFVRESHKVDSYIDITSTVTYFQNIFESAPKPCMAAVMGEHGGGKSTMLYQLKNKTSLTSDWFFFDAWKYPRRSELWEGFITEIVKKLGLDENAIDQIKGRSTISEGANVLSKILTATETISGTLGLKVVGELVAKLFQGDPITKLEGFHELLNAILLERNKPLYIVVEDIDRSKDQGLFFIETLRYFLTKNESEISDIVVIVPMSEERYESEKSSYLKCFDITERFSLKDINFNDFVKNGLNESAVLDSPLINHNITFPFVSAQISNFLNLLVQNHRNLTIREIKLILRNANKEHRTKKIAGLNPDYRISLCIEAMKWIPVNNKSNLTHWDQSDRQKRIDKLYSKTFIKFLTAILTNRESFEVLANAPNNMLDIEIVDLPGNEMFPLFKQSTLPKNKKISLLSSYFY